MRVIALLIYLYAGNPHAEIAWVESYEKCLEAGPVLEEMVKEDPKAKFIRFECIRGKI
jgi:hypothetical protein